jgi:diketogulonate reductase-like aldo/keto reductase
MTLEITRSTLLRTAGAAGVATALAPIAHGQTAMPGKMHLRIIPSSGAQLPVVGCGTWRTFDVGSQPKDRAPLAEVLRILFGAGGSVIDSSPMYGAAEGVVGDLLREMKARDKAFVATKVWTQGRTAGIAQMERSMQLMAADPIDLMQIHNLLDWRTHLATLRAWKAEGRIRYLGVTHYTTSAYAELEAVMRAEKLDFVQLNYAVDDRQAEQRLLPLAAERGMAVLVNQPFGGGGLIRKLASRPLPAWAGEIGCTSWAQILLKFVLGHPAVTCVIPGTGRPEHMKDNVGAGFGIFPDEAMRKRMAASIDA